MLCVSLSFASHPSCERNRCGSCAASGGCLRTDTLTKLRDKSQNADSESIRPLLLEPSNLRTENLGTHQKQPGRIMVFWQKSCCKRIRAKFLMLIESKPHGYEITAFFHAVRAAPNASLAALQEERASHHTRVRFL